jgi:L,D-transpeptidase catalytic domain
MLKKIVLNLLLLPVLLHAMPAFKPTRDDSDADRMLIFQIVNPLAKGECGVLHGSVSLVEIRVDGSMWIKAQYPAIYGINGCDKNWRGDKKTPLGKYHVIETRKKSLSSPSERNKFGGYSIPIDYPNREDVKDGYTGGDIAIHGGRVGGTLGCARVLDGTMDAPSLGKENIEQVAQFVKKGTPVILMENLAQELLGFEGQLLADEPTRFWRTVLSDDIGRKRLRYWCTEYQSHLSPTIAPAPQSQNVTVSVSGVLNNDARYTEKHLIDQMPYTAWCFSNKMSDKSAIFEFPAERELHRLVVKTGYDKLTPTREDRWRQNSRATAFRLTFDRDSIQTYQIGDIRESQLVDLKSVVKTKKVRVEITGIKLGMTYSDDVCISELNFE